MSNNPYIDHSLGPSHLSTRPSAASATGKLKGSTKTFAIILLILGIWRSFNAILAPIMVAVGQAFLSIASEGNSNPNANAQLARASAELSNFYNPLNLALLVASFILGAGMIYGGIGTLRRKLLGAQVLRWCAGLMVILIFIQSGYQIFFLVRNREAMAQDFENQLNSAGPNGAPPGMENMVHIIFAFQIIFAVLFALAFILLYFFSFLHFNNASNLAQFKPAADGGNKIP